MQRPALRVYAGPRALVLLRERGLRAADVAVVAGAAGGPKGLILGPLDRYLFGRWLTPTGRTVHLLGASIGAWRMACACATDPDAALAALSEDYVTERYEQRAGGGTRAAQVSASFGAMLQRQFDARAAEVLSHPQRRLHVFVGRGLGPLARQGRWRTPIGYLGAVVANAVHRRALGLLLERVVFSDPREPLPLALRDYRTRVVPLSLTNLAGAVLASCSIPFWLDAVAAIDGAPEGAYWDGGLTDYHLHLDYAGLGDAIALIPHFQPTLVPGWLDKPFKRRHRAGPALANAVVLAPDASWVRDLPGGKLPDRSDFKRYGSDHAARERAWRQAIDRSRQLADEFAALADGRPVHALPLP